MWFDSSLLSTTGGSGFVVDVDVSVAGDAVASAEVVFDSEATGSTTAGDASVDVAATSITTMGSQAFSVGAAIGVEGSPSVEVAEDDDGTSADSVDGAASAVSGKVKTVPVDGVGVDVVFTITTVDGGGVVGATDVDAATLTGVFVALVVAIVACLLGDGPGIRLVDALRALTLVADAVGTVDGVAREGVPGVVEGTGD